MDIGTRELRRRLSEILDRVAEGEKVRIVRRGRLAAELRALQDKPAGLPDFAAFRASIRLKGRATSRSVVEERRKSRA